MGAAVPAAKMQKLFVVVEQVTNWVDNQLGKGTGR